MCIIKTQKYSVVGAQRAFRQEFDLSPRTASTTMEIGASVKTARTPEIVNRVREALPRSPRKMEIKFTTCG